MTLRQPACARTASAATLALLASCLSTPTAPPGPIAKDIHSHAEPERVRVTHVGLDLELDFEERVVAGASELSFVRPDPAAPLVLDVQALEIEAVKGADGRSRRFSIGPPDGRLGSALRIDLEPGDERVRVLYRTTEDSEALQWLAPEQTAGKRRPFLFTQGQSIFTRTWIPLQDTPGVRVTYDARVRGPEDLAVVMSAERIGKDLYGFTHFSMRNPIPPYLIALACGELEFRPISERCG